MRLLIFFINIILINISFLISYQLRYFGDIPPRSFTPFKQSYIFLTLIFILALAYAKVYRRRFRSYWLLFGRVVTGITIGTVFSIVFLYLLRIRWSSFPSSVFVINYFLLTGLIFSFNAIIYKIRGKVKKRLVVLGEDSVFDPFCKKASLVQIKHINDIDELMKCRDIDEVVLCRNIEDDSKLNLLIYLLNSMKVPVSFSPDLYADLIYGKFQNEHAVKFLSTFIGNRSDFEEFLIRIVDVTLSFIMLVILSPLLLLISLVIKITSEGPVIYKQKRVGKDSREFVIYKFRTMVKDAEKINGLEPASDGDKRITRIGKILRITRLDELPQLLNVLKGDMSLVGPRPENIYRVNRHKALQGIRLAVKPGLTGLAQIRSYYDLHPKHKIKYDYLYIQRRSFMLNLYILLKTIPVVINKKGQ